MPVEHMETPGYGNGYIGTEIHYLRIEGILDFENDALALLRRVQFKQDRGDPWGLAVERAIADGLMTL
jgi:hypothetical protein